MQDCILAFSSSRRAEEVEAVIEHEKVFFEKYWGKFGKIWGIAIGFNRVRIKAKESWHLFLLSVDIVIKSLVSK